MGWLEGREEAEGEGEGEGRKTSIVFLVTYPIGPLGGYLICLSDNVEVESKKGR